MICLLPWSPFAEGVAFSLMYVFLKSVLLFAVAGLLVLLLRRSSAAHRHLIWMLTLGAILCLPLFSRLVPGHRVGAVTILAPIVSEQPSPPASIPSTSQPKPQAKTVLQERPVSTIQTQVTSDIRSTYTETTWYRTLNLICISVTGIWIFGVILSLGRTSIALFRLGCLKRELEPMTEERMVNEAAEIVRLAGIRKSIQFFVAPDESAITVPLTWGFWRPAIVLPANATLWPTERLRAALLHELAHVKRGDWLVQMAAGLLCAIYWFNPIVWAAAILMRQESERAADDYALTHGLRASDYAMHLLEIAQMAQHRRQFPQQAIAMAQSSHIEKRLKTVLTLGLRRESVRSRAAATMLTIVILLALPLAALRLRINPPIVPVHAADHLQLSGNFTLRYQVTMTDEETTQAQFREYQQLLATCQQELKKDPKYQPIPLEYDKPFSYFQSRRPRTRHVILSVSAHNGQLTWLSQENGHTMALIYNGRNGTQRFWDGHPGGLAPGLAFFALTDCPLPAVGFPHLPLLKRTELVESTGIKQTWQGESPLEGASVRDGQVVYTESIAHAVMDRGTWKISDVDSLGQRFQYLQYQRFQGLWLASQMRFTYYVGDKQPSKSPMFRSLAELISYVDRHRTETRRCEYRLLSASDTALNLNTMEASSVRPQE